MDSKQIESHRGVYPIKMSRLCKYSSFEQILGKKKSEYSLEEKKKRWNKVMALDLEMKKHWGDTELCRGCKHLSADAWCIIQELPCTVNPVISFRSGLFGMACMGLGFEKV